MVKESDESNNTKSISLSPLLPDLFIYDFTWTPVSPVLGEFVSFLVTVKNQGSGGSPVADVKLDIDDNFYII